MTDEEYWDTRCLAKLRDAIHIAHNLTFHEDPNKTRIMGINANLRLIESDLEKKVDKHLDGE